MNGMLLRIGVACVVAYLALASAAPAYEIKESEAGQPLWWQEMPVEYRLVSGNVPGASTGESAVHRAYATWDRASSNVRYEFAGFENEGAQAFDHKNLTYWIYEGWPFDERAAALTFHYYDTKNGRLLDADIVFNGERFSWSIGGTGLDIENSAAHEVGHFGGLGHSSHSDATMYSHTSVGETGKRTLASDDIEGLEALYGGTGTGTGAGSPGATSGSATGLGGGGGGGCSIAPAQASAGAGELSWLGLLFALLVARIYRRRC